MNRELFDPAEVVNTAAPTSFAVTLCDLLLNRTRSLQFEDALMIGVVPSVCTATLLFASLLYRTYKNEDLAFVKRRARELRKVNPALELSASGIKQGNIQISGDEYVKALEEYHRLEKLKDKSSLYAGRYLNVVKKLKKLGHRFQEVVPRPSLKSIRAELTGNHERLAASARLERNVAQLYDAINIAKEKKDYDSMLIYLRDFADIAGMQSIKKNFAVRFETFGLSISNYLYPSDIMGYFSRSALHIINGQRNAAWQSSRLGRDVADFKGEYRREAYVFHALLSSALHSSTAQQDWQDACNVVREGPVWERIGETRSIVRIIKDSRFLSKSILFKESSSLEDLVQEAENIGALQEIVGDRAALPEVLYTSDEDDPFIVMRFLEGDTLLKRLESEDYSRVGDVVSLLAKVHSYVPKDAKRLSIPYYLRSRLISEHFGVPRELAKSVVSHYRPVYNSLEDSVWVYNKDAHPENWIISEDKIGIIDCEGKSLVPAQFDLVNLLEYGSFFSDEQKGEYIDLYLSRFRKPGRSSFLLGYWNAVIHRMIGLSSAWSSPIRPSMHDKRKDAVARALHAIDVIESEFSDYFEQHKANYEGLRVDFQNIATLIS
ncbi:aminoglycoside phosphotransferase family protein [Candidatus Woesearchaeota archaeon]|nr:aminoglycoside phosphotransferase family protein [Candidatus Woesearchaeota archaeon]